jgi:hypothetical protein
MSRKLPPKKFIIGKKFHYLHKKGINCYTNAYSESYTAEKMILYVSHGMYSALHSVHDQTILFTSPEDHGECSRPCQNDRLSVHTTASETTECKRRLQKNNLVLAQRAMRLVLLSGIHTNQWKTSALDTMLRQNKIHS